MELCPYSYFWWCKYFWGPWVSFGTTDVFSVRVTKLLQGLVSYEITAYLSVFDLCLTQWVMALLLKGCQPQTTLNHKTLQNLTLQILESLFEFCWLWISPDYLALCETNLDDSVDSGNLSVRGCRFHSVTHSRVL